MDRHEPSVETQRLSSQRLDTLLRALAAQPRRMIYTYLAEHESATITELTDVVVGWSQVRGRSTDACNWDDTRTILHHRHLPALDAAGIITYDAAQRTASLASLSPSATEVLVTLTDLDTAETDHED